MASFTQQALRHTLLVLLERQPLDKITVKMLVDACGVSRNTFYYHYDDIPSLLADTLEAEFAKTANGGQGDLLLRLLTMVAGHRQVFAHIDHSQSREILRRRLYQAMETNVRHSLEESGGTPWRYFLPEGSGASSGRGWKTAPRRRPRHSSAGSPRCSS